MTAHLPPGRCLLALACCCICPDVPCPGAGLHWDGNVVQDGPERRLPMSPELASSSAGVGPALPPAVPSIIQQLAGLSTGPAPAPAPIAPAIAPTAQGATAASAGGVSNPTNSTATSAGPPVAVLFVGLPTPLTEISGSYRGGSHVRLCIV